MALEIFKGASKAMAPIIARRIGKDEFLRQLGEAWAPVVKKETNIEDEVSEAMKRIKDSGFQKTFDAAGITESDIEEVLSKIRREKTYPTVRMTPKVGRNAPCPCGSGKKYKKCCLNKDQMEGLYKEEDTGRI